jgi:proteasome component ECM29
VEQHAERIGLDSGRLENLRVAASRSSPMADTLDLCARHANAAAVEALTPALCQLVRRGVGLNTRVGTARFVANLSVRLGGGVRPQSGALLKVLAPSCMPCIPVC